MEGTHQIRRLRCSVRGGREEDALRVRTRVRETLQPAWLAEIEDGFREAAPEHGTLHIPLLTLELRVADLDDVAPALSRLALEQIRALSFATLSEPPASSPARELAALLEYLRTGTLPWDTAASPRGQTLVLLSRAAGRIETVAADLPASFSPALAFLTRWLPLLPAHRWIEIARRLDAGHADETACQALRSLDDYAVATPGFHRRFEAASAVLALARAASPAFRSEATPDTPEATILVARLLDPAVTTTEKLAAFLERVPAPLRSLLAPSVVAPVQYRSEAEALHAARKPPPSRPGPPPSAGADAVSRRVDTASRSDRAFGMTVAHAGLILIHPFLPRLFSQTRVLAADATAIPASELPRAAALLRFASSGEDDVYEFDLALVKVLLGLVPDSALPVSPGLLRPTDRVEISGLLDSVIEHWSILGNSSAAALRTSFLQRSGLLEPFGPAWKLRIEESPFDMLLSRLPWGLGTIKFSWMPAPVFVEWNTH